MKQNERKRKSQFYENLTRINTILLSILLVVVGLDFLKNILQDNPDLLYPLFYAFLGFALITYIQQIIFGHFDNNIAPLLSKLREDLRKSNQPLIPPFVYLKEVSVMCSLGWVRT